MDLVTLTPSGNLYFVDQDCDWRISLFNLAANREPTDDPVVKFWRSLGDAFINSLCRLPDNLGPEDVIPPTLSQFRSWVEGAPPMGGGEYLSPEILSLIWMKLTGWTSDEVLKYNNLAEFLATNASRWERVGRVSFHLAENTADPDRPFAFMASYVVGLNQDGRERHQPLGQALNQYIGEENRLSLLKLLTPVKNAAEKLPWVAEMVESKQIYQPTAFTIPKAYQLLKNVPELEDSGLTVRIPDWWKKKPSVRVKVKVGEKKTPVFGLDSLVDWDVNLAVGDQDLTSEEIEEILAADEKLILFKGQWLEVDRNKLSQALAHWKSVKASSPGDGISFIKAMRLLAGFSVSGRDESEELEESEVWVHADAGTALREVLDKLRDPQSAKAPESLKATLRPYQEKGLAWLSLLSGLGLGACLADDMGLGKTMQVLALLLLDNKRMTERRPSLLVAPASLLGNWKAEADKFAPTLNLNIYHPSETSPDILSKWEKNPASLFEKSDLVVTSYTLLNKNLAFFSKIIWRMMILDEAQAIKNPATGQSRAVKKIKSDVRLALTGTPIENRLGDVWSLFDFLNPGLLGSAKKFKAITDGLINRTADQYAPLRKLISPYLLRRLKTDKRIINDLPDKTETNVLCWLSQNQAKLYNQVVEELKKSLSEFKSDSSAQIHRRGLVLQSLMRLKQLCNHPAQLTGDGDWNSDRSGKFLRITELTREMAERQDRLLVFTKFKEIIEPLGRWLTTIFNRPGLALHGSTPVVMRKKLVDEFQKDNGPPFFILSLKAGGTGLNLTAASQVIHFDRWWNPAVEDQATDRAFRIGQKKNVLVHKCITKGTLEEKIDAMLQGKRHLADEILDQKDEVNLVNMDDESLLNLISLDFDRAVMV